MNERFWSKVDKSGGPDSCWMWTGSRNKKKGKLTYGLFKPAGEKTTPAHRYSYRERYGSIPDGLLVCHRCNNPGCVNPEHLYAADNATNIRDAYRDGLAVPHNRDTVKPNCPKCGGAYSTTPSGRRRCLPCYNQNQRIYRQKVVKPKAALISADTKRLDWIDSQRAKIEPFYENGATTGVTIILPLQNGRDVYGDTVRAAIDAAMSSPSGAPEGMIESQGYDRGEVRHVDAGAPEETKHD